MYPDSLKELVEDNLLMPCAAAVSMSMHQLLDKRADFIQAVQNAVSETLLNGLELESVSLTVWIKRQSSSSMPKMPSDAEGLTKLT